MKMGGQWKPSPAGLPVQGHCLLHPSSEVEGRPEMPTLYLKSLASQGYCFLPAELRIKMK